MKGTGKKTAFDHNYIKIYKLRVKRALAYYKYCAEWFVMTRDPVCMTYFVNTETRQAYQSH
jgi:hypothetical protein